MTRLLPVTLLLLLLGSLSALTLGQRGPAPATASHVVIISLDGFAAWALEDPYLPIPTLRRLAATGAVARGMRPVNPTVTWANHTSMVTGVTPAKHGVIFNGLLIREPGVPPRVEPWRDKKELVRVRTLYDAAHDRGLTTAQVDWVAIQNAPTITWEFAERPPPTATVPRELAKAGLLSQPDLESFAQRNIVWRDEMWTTAAEHIVRQHRPNLLLFHLLNLDSTQHRYGPRTPAAMTTMALLDRQVARVLDAIDDSGLTPRTTVFVVSDHGFKTVRRQIRPNAAFVKAGLIAVDQKKVTRAEAYSVPEGGTALVYITVPDASGDVLTRAKNALAGVEGIAAIVEPPEFQRYGLPQPADNTQMGALLLVGAEGYAFTAEAAEPAVVDAPPGSLGAHGYVASDPDLRALFIASGRGIRGGVTVDEVNTIDLAPTAAHLLGVKLEQADGRVLTEVLAPAAAAIR